MPSAHATIGSTIHQVMAVDAKVAGVAQAVVAAQKWKKGLLQQMFV